MRVHDRLRVDDDLDAGRRRRRTGECASISSRPLFISVAESMVILPPSARSGARSACSGVASASARPARAAERAARGGQHQALDGRRGRALQALRERRVLAVDRQQLPSGAVRARRAPGRRRRPGSPCWRARRRPATRTPPAWRAGRRRRPPRSGRCRRRSFAPARARPPRPPARGRRIPARRARPQARRQGRPCGAVPAGRLQQRLDRLPPASPQTARSGFASTISSACTPIDPVAPSTHTDLIRYSLPAASWSSVRGLSRRSRPSTAAGCGSPRSPPPTARAR